MITQIKKRDGSTQAFQKEKITWAIFKAVTAVGGDDFDNAQTDVYKRQPIFRTVPIG